MSNSDNLTLPNSSSTKKPTEIHVQIAATTDMILVDNNPVFLPRTLPDIAGYRRPDYSTTAKKVGSDLQGGRRTGQAWRLNQIVGAATIQIDKMSNSTCSIKS